MYDCEEKLFMKTFMIHLLVVLFFVVVLFHASFIAFMIFSCLVVVGAFFHLKKLSGRVLKTNFGLILYFLFLIKEVVVSAVSMSKIILFSNSKNIRPVFTEVQVEKSFCQNDSAVALLANSITLTPGTITIDVSQDKIYVHAIDKKTLSGVKGLSKFIATSQSV